MKYIFMIYSIILLPFSKSQHNTKLCIDCKFYKKDFLTFSKFGKCEMFPTEGNVEYYLVNGKKDNNDIEYYYCSTSRKFDYMCGKEGKFYEKKI